jgi:hypothetical protein
MATANKSDVVTRDELLQPWPTPIRIDEHQRDLERRAREYDERCPLLERLKLCDPVYAGKVEARKPKYKFEITWTHIITRPPSAVVFDDSEPGNKFELETRRDVIVAKNESDAWAMLCDRRQDWPSPRVSQPKFKKLGTVKD